MRKRAGGGGERERERERKKIVYVLKLGKLIQPEYSRDVYVC